MPGATARFLEFPHVSGKFPHPPLTRSSWCLTVLPMTAYDAVRPGDVVTFGSHTSRWRVLDHPSTGNGTLMVECIAHPFTANVGTVQLLVESHTDIKFA